ncbi:MAG: DNA repair protein RecO [Eggerthellaceae bacterium]|jgi:DNA repair protein RecO (recombination protein O)
MAARTYRDQVIVLRKTKLKESDLILTLLAQDGRQVRAVAKGARKPTSSFAARLDLFSNARVLFASGRNLDIVKEARLVDAHEPLRLDIGLSACASPLAELLAKATQDALPVPRLFDMTQAAFSTLESVQGTVRLLLVAGYLLKASALLGFRPILRHCVECGASLDPADCPDPLRFSARAGGVLCSACAQGQDAVPLAPAIVGWAATLLGARFAELESFDADEDTAYAILRMAQMWTREHIGRLKSLEMLLAMGVY